MTTFYDHASAPLTSLDEGPLRGLRHRTIIDHETGASSLALWQEEHLPGFRVPPHLHDCEEIITVTTGTIRADVGGSPYEVMEGRSILIPAWTPHGFEVVSGEPVRLLAIFGSSDPGIFREDGSPSTPPWRGGASGHLEVEAGKQPAL